MVGPQQISFGGDVLVFICKERSRFHSYTSFGCLIWDKVLGIREIPAPNNTIPCVWPVKVFGLGIWTQYHGSEPNGKKRAQVMSRGKAGDWVCIRRSLRTPPR
jgi:hypothetical protein